MVKGPAKSISYKSSLISSKHGLIVALAVLVLVVLGLELTNTTHFFHKAKAKSGPIPTVSVSPSKKTTSTNANQATSSSSDGNNATSAPAKYSPPVGSVGGTLVAPSGTFVSNHRPSLSGAANQKSEQSSCNTTPGAKCYIRFVQGSVTKTLPTQTTDASGATIWNWNIDSSGLTEGSWDVAAVASLNDLTKSATDPIKLEVQP